MLIALDDRFLYVFKKAGHFFGIGDKVFVRVVYSKKGLSCGAIVEYDVELQRKVKITFIFNALYVNITII